MPESPYTNEFVLSVSLGGIGELFAEPCCSRDGAAHLDVSLQQGHDRELPAVTTHLADVDQGGGAVPAL